MRSMTVWVRVWLGMSKMVPDWLGQGSGVTCPRWSMTDWVRLWSGLTRMVLDWLG